MKRFVWTKGILSNELIAIGRYCERHDCTLLGQGGLG
jgi:hypothetical protein